MTSQDEQDSELDLTAQSLCENGNSTNVKEDAKQEVAPRTRFKWRRRKVWCTVLAFVLVLGSILVSVVPSLLISKECPNEWIPYRNKCYFISKEENNWTSSQSLCAERKSLLAVFENQEEMLSLAEHLEMDEYWIGLCKKGEIFYWENGVPLRMDLFQIRNHSECAYLETSILTSSCSLPRRCICVQLP